MLCEGLRACLNALRKAKKPDALIYLIPATRDYSDDGVVSVVAVKQRFRATEGPRRDASPPGRAAFRVALTCPGRRGWVFQSRSAPATLTWSLFLDPQELIIVLQLSRMELRPPTGSSQHALNSTEGKVRRKSFGVSQYRVHLLISPGPRDDHWGFWK
ncbi:hypothetical protein NDU88_002112 [Pleurodeles waltl]|uniref:Uncharacterized protein n=1 Tax=Pleurodeles waltl TaxID=8319 RepID=A0AAV7MRU2_PLEWA|nr:hypothetical protein NDU88_002112 [Pleurodeles waltl]